MENNFNDNLTDSTLKAESTLTDEKIKAINAASAEEIDALDETGDVAQEEEFLSDKVRTISSGRMVMKRFFRSKLSVAGLAMIIFLFAFSFLGPIFTTWGEIEVDRTAGQPKYAQTPITIISDGEEHIIYSVTESPITENIKAKPSIYHLLGTDERGMDVLARLMYGGRVSLMLGFIVIFLETIVGVALGGLAGYFGKWVDQLIMRIVDVFQCLPMLPILLIASALIDAWGVPQTQRIYYLMVILTFFGWSGTARLVRGQILTLREQEYIVAAEALGLSAGRKIFRHLIPNVMPQLIVSMTLGLGGIILYESTLSYLSLGVPLPYAAWGTMISASQDPDILASFFNIWVPPGICIVLAVLGFNFVGDGLRDALDPKMKR